MIASLRRMITCHWSAQRLGHYLDHDPSAPLTPAEVRRLENHLAVCERCSRIRAEHHALHQALSRWSVQRVLDEAALARLHDTLDRVTSEGHP